MAVNLSQRDDPTEGADPLLRSPDPMLARSPIRRRWPHRLSTVIFLVGLLITAALTVASQVSYRHNEQRLTALQTKLTASLLGTAPSQFQGQLGRVAGLAAESTNPVATFKSAIAKSLTPTGPFASAVLVLIVNGHPQELAHVGTRPIRSLNSPADVALFGRAARTSSLVTTRAVGRGEQKLGYLLSAHGHSGTFVVGAAQQLPIDKRIALPASSPVADLDLAIYFGRSTSASALIESTVAHPPLRGIVSTMVVPFGTSVLTLVVSPRGSLSGRWSEFLPWGILIVGVLFVALVAGMTEWLVRRREYAEALASTNRQLYRQQRSVATALQQALLPKALPDIAGVELAARYIPSTSGADIGGDWYSVVPVAPHRFVFVVGDVSGHGIDAASVMGSLRYTTRTLARLGFSPAEILDRANAEINISTDDHFATVLIGSIDLMRSEMTLASAGHMPPLVLDSGESTFVDLPIGSPLGIETRPHESLTMTFAPGTTLIAFTDGLVEHRRRSIDDGLRTLAEAASQDAPTADGLLSAVVAALSSDGNEDDIAVLAVRC